MEKKSYRTSNMIIQNILEGILRKRYANPYEKNDIKKSELIDYCNLKTSTAEKYLTKMENAKYIESYKEPWGKRTIIKYNITDLGIERYEWFVKINVELE